MVSRREELIFLGKNNPKLFWKELQANKNQTENNITVDQWLEYARKIYERNPKVDPPPPFVNIATITKLFTVQEIEVGIKKLGVGKVKDLVEIQAGYLKWGSKLLHLTLQESSTTSFSRDSLQIGQLASQFLFSRTRMSTIPPIIRP